MWKYLARGMRESLERRSNFRSNIVAQSPQEDDVNKSDTDKEASPRNNVLVVTNNSNSGGPHEEYNSSTRPWWRDAFSWWGTSLLTFGMALSHTVCRKRNLYEPETGYVPKCKYYPDLKLTNLVNRVKNIEPLQVLGKTYCDSGKSSIGDESLESEKDNFFGPPTVEEAREKAKREFEKLHQQVLAEYELHYGIEALEEGRHEDAVRHFIKGAQLSSSKNMFNLGLCYEKGIGTANDIVQAASYYKKAADLGHPDALYNLGVFHVHGRGGLSTDRNKARSLFEKAARLGHSEAQRALDLDLIYQNELKAQSESEIDNSDARAEEQIPNKTMDNRSFLKRILSFKKVPKKDIKTETYSKTPTDVFLESLGVHQVGVSPMSVSVGE